MENQVFGALCLQETNNFDETKVLPSGLIYRLKAMTSDRGTVAYYIWLDDEDMGIIKAEQFKNSFLKTTLTSLAELPEIDGDREVIAWV